MAATPRREISLPRTRHTATEAMTETASRGQILAKRLQKKTTGGTLFPSYVQARTKPDRTKKNVTPLRPYQVRSLIQGSSPVCRDKW